MFAAGSQETVSMSEPELLGALKVLSELSNVCKLSFIVLVLDLKKKCSYTPRLAVLLKLVKIFCSDHGLERRTVFH